MKKEINDWKDLYGRERNGFYEKNGWRVEDVERINREKGNIEEEILGRERLRYTEERKIKEARYNKRV